MEEIGRIFTGSKNRRSFLKTGVAAGAATVGAGMFTGKISALQHNGFSPHERRACRSNATFAADRYQHERHE